MIKYVLNSGGIRNNPDSSRKFFAEIFKGLSNKPTILFCLFAQKREDWEKRFVDYKNGWSKFFPAVVDPVFEMALPNNFENKIKNSDIILFCGGDDYLLQYWLKKYDLQKLLEGKVVVGTSASSNLFSKYFWTCDWRNCMDGFGILPIKFLPHFKSSYGDDDPRGPIDWDKALIELKNYKENLPVYALTEGEYVVIEK